MARTFARGKKIRPNVTSRKTELRAPSDKGSLLGGAFGLLGWIIGSLCKWGLGILVLGTVSAGILFSYRWVTAHEFFKLTTLNIQGIQRLSRDEISQIGGVAVGDNILNINIADVQRRIAACEWIENVSVTRVLPDGLTIDVHERTPFFLMRRDDRLYYADVQGRPIVAVGVDKFVSLPLLEKEDGVPVCSGILDLLDEISRNTLPFGMRQVAWVRQDSAEQYSIFLEKPRVLIQLDGTDLHATLACLSKLWGDLQARGELERMAFMFVMPSRAWIKLKADQTL